jgi:hypothetical protein
LRGPHRGTFLVAWEHIARIDDDAVRLRKGFIRYSPVLRQSDSPDESTPRANV